MPAHTSLKDRQTDSAAAYTTAHQTSRWVVSINNHPRKGNWTCTEHQQPKLQVNPPAGLSHCWVLCQATPRPLLLLAAEARETHTKETPSAATDNPNHSQSCACAYTHSHTQQQAELSLSQAVLRTPRDPTLSQWPQPAPKPRSPTSQPTKRPTDCPAPRETETQRHTATQALLLLSCCCCAG